MKTDGVLFDLDGTLWDATLGMTRAWAALLAGIPDMAGRVITREQVKGCMGMLLPDIMDRLFPDQPAERRKYLLETYCEAELELLGREGGELYPHAEETLEELSRRFPLFIVSNCQEGYIQCFMQAHRLEHCFAEVVSAGGTGQPKAKNIADLVQRRGLKAPVYVGDTDLDRRSAAQAGVPFIHAAYGFGRAEGTQASIRALPDLCLLLEKAGE